MVYIDTKERWETVKTRPVEVWGGIKPLELPYPQDISRMESIILPEEIKNESFHLEKERDLFFS